MPSSKSSSNRGGALLAGLAVLAGVDVAWLAAQASPNAERDAFQVATGGLGLGSAVSCAWSFHAFDPRLEATCDNELWPIPGLACANPHHGASVADLPRMERRRK
jgi:hypothetical protein